MSKSYAIIGGGILGMTLALRLRQKGHVVTLFEAADHLGGLADGWQFEDITWDRHYHVTLLSDLRTRGILNELGLEEDMVWVETRTGFYTGGKHYSMSNTLEFLKFPPLDMVSKLRLGATIFFAARMKNWRKLEQVPVVDFLRKWSGKKTTEKIWLPLLRAKLGENYTRASAAFIWAIIQRMYAARQSGLKKEMFGYLNGGYDRMLKRFTEVLEEQGVTIRCSCPTTAVAGTESGVTVDGESFDRAVLTIPSSLACRIVQGLSEAEAQQHAAIQYQGIICASILLKKPLQGFYVTNITDPVPFTAVIEMTALVDPTTFGGRSLIYLPKYVDPQDPAFERSDEEFRAEFSEALLRMYPELHESDLLAFQVSRVRHVLALSTVGYSTRLPPIKTSVPNVYIANSAHIVNGTLNVNDTITLAERIAEEELA